MRSKYGNVSDVLHKDCAGKDVSDNLVFYVIAGELPRKVESGDGDLYDFYPFHEPEDSCYAHSVIACKKRGSTSDYDKPTQGVRNKLKAHFVSAFMNHRIGVTPEKNDDAAAP